jgi:hypothetical protein
MPEHDTYDGALDAAFAHLEQDISTLSTAPGAGAAVARARRRRRTTAGAIAAVAVLAVGGAAIAQGLGHRDTSIQPAATLPTGAPLDAAALTAATDGWTTSWLPADSQAAAVLNGPISHCLDASPALSQVAEPVRSSRDLSFTAGPVASFGVLADFADQQAQADYLWTSIRGTVSQCSNATLTGQQAWDGGEADSYALTSASGTTHHLWLAHTGATFGMLWVADAPAVVPSSADAAVGTALVAALRWPGSYHDTQTDSGTASSSSSASASSADFATVSEAAFAQALDGWSSGWRRTGSQDAQVTMPCHAVDWQSGSSSGMGSSLGANGEQDYWVFDNPADAERSRAALAQALHDCTSATYDVHTVPARGGGTVTVAAGSTPQDWVLWIAQDGPNVAYVQVPAGDTAPPGAVTAQLGGLLHVALSHHRGGDAPQASPSGVPQEGSSAVASSAP